MTWSCDNSSKSNNWKLIMFNRILNIVCVVKEMKELIKIWANATNRQQIQWNVKMTVIPIVVWAFGTVLQNQEKRLDEMEIKRIIKAIYDPGPAKLALILLWSSDRTVGRTIKQRVIGKRYCISRKRKSYKGITSRARLSVPQSNVL